MANQEHLDVLKQGVEVWNQWRKEHPEIQPDFSGANLHDINLSKADFRRANFRNANLTRSNLSRANLSRANLGGIYLGRADLTRANLAEADLSKGMLKSSNLTRANLIGANMTETDLGRTILTEANLSGANMTGCFIYAVSAWDVRLENTIQSNLVITRLNQPTITVDNLEVAQFIYLLLNNQKIRDVIETITSKAVLILGRFTPERKVVLDALREELRKQDYVPVLFDFDEPASRDVTETVTTLARISRFIIADITDPRSIPQELALIIPTLPSVPVQPLLHSSQQEYGMFSYFTRFPWVLPLYHYTDQVSLLQSLKECVIEPAEQKAKELAHR